MKATRGRALSSAQIGNPIVPDSRRFSERAARAAAVAARRAAGHGLAAVVVVGRGERARAGAALISRCVAPGEGRGERQPGKRTCKSAEQRLGRAKVGSQSFGWQHARNRISAFSCWRQVASTLRFLKKWPVKERSGTKNRRGTVRIEIGEVQTPKGVGDG